MTRSDIDALIGEATKGIADEDGRKARTDTLSAMLQIENSPGSGFPEPWRSEPNVMFETGDPRPEPFAWGRPNWDTERAYDEDLAAFLGDLACNRDAPEAQVRGLARRALEAARLQDGEPDRVWPRLFAARVIGADCSLAGGWPTTCAASSNSSQRRPMRRPLHRRPPRLIAPSRGSVTSTGSPEAGRRQDHHHREADHRG